MRYLLDTDTCIEVIRRRQPASDRVRAHSPDDLAVATMTVAELIFGALNSSQPARGLESVEALLSAEMAQLDFDSQAAEHHARIRLALRANPIGERDLVIAATARSAGLRVVTRNRQHFERVPELRVDDWIAG